MIEVTCFQCRTRVRISPAAYACPKCEQDLRQLLSQEQVSGHFYNRASALAANGEFQAALQEVETGLTFYGSSELHLLAAILAQQLGRYDQMRHHVAAIPLEDSLRGEAEWLLRSHEDRQRALREGLRVDRNVRRGGIQANRSIMVQEFSGRAPGSTPAAVRRVGLLKAFAVGSVVIFSLIVLLVAVTDLFPEQLEPLWDSLTFTRATPLPDSLADDADPDAATTPSPSDIMSGQTPGLVQNGLQTLAPDAPGLSAIVRDAGRDDLLALGLTVRVEEGRAVVQGSVELDEQRRALIELLNQSPDIQEVDLSAVQLQPPAVYVVQSGDTLWTIVFNIYGNVDQLDAIAQANRDILPSPEALQPGMELRIPRP